MKQIPPMMFLFVVLFTLGCIDFTPNQIYSYPEDGFKLENNTYIDANGIFVEYNDENQICFNKKNYKTELFEFECNQGLLFQAREVDSKISTMPRAIYFKNNEDIEKIKNLTYEINGIDIPYNLKGKIVGSETHSYTLETSEYNLTTYLTYYSIENIEVVKISSEQFYFKNYTKENFMRNKEISCYYEANFSNTTTIPYKLGRGKDIYLLSDILVVEVNWTGFENYYKDVYYKNDKCEQYDFYEETKTDFFVCYLNNYNDYNPSNLFFLLSDKQINSVHVQDDSFYEYIRFEDESVFCFGKGENLNFNLSEKTLLIFPLV